MDYFIPEIILLLIFVALLVSEISFFGESTRPILLLTPIGLLTALIQLLMISSASGMTFAQKFSWGLQIDSVAVFFKIFFITLSLLVVLLSFYAKEIPFRRLCEYHCFIVIACLAMCLAVSASDWIVLFLALQLANLMMFFMVGYRKDSPASNEAGLKFLLSSVVASGFILIAISLIYGHTHSFDLSVIHEMLLSEPMTDSLAWLIFGLAFLALSFYCAVFPFYLWINDVLEGAPSPSAAFLGIGVPALGISVVTRLFYHFQGMPSASWPDPHFSWTWLLAIASGLSMLIGAVMASRQESIKRIASNLIIFHSGFILMGFLVAGEKEGLAASFYNLVVDLFGFFGIFLSAVIVSNQSGKDYFRYFRQNSSQAFFESFFLLMFLAAIVGLPPFSTFFGRFAVINAMVQGGWYVLAIIALVAWLITALVFAKVTYAVVSGLREAHSTLHFQPSTPLRIFLFLLLIPVVLLGFWSEPLLGWGRAALFH